jgi:uncharacterized protein with PQ loop repeat
VDYSACFPDQEIIWSVVGFLIFIGTWVSVCPQYYLICHTRSSFGLDVLALTGMVFGQFVLVANILCLRTPDFIGWLQLPFLTVIGRSLTFVTAIGNWLGFLPISFLALVFFDFVPRELRDSTQIKRERRINPILAIVGPSLCGVVMVVYTVIGITNGFESDAIVDLGKVCGALAAALWAVQYFPQLWMTFKLKSSGNLSLILVGIQAPGSLVTAVFMCIGQSDDWTTWLSSALLSIEQFVLLGMGIYYDCRKVKGKEETVALISTELAVQSYQ